MARALLALGSNLGCPAENLSQAIENIAFFSDTHLLARGSWHSTEPIGGPAGQDVFLNASVLLETRLQPLELSQQIHELESRMGRERRVRWDARLIDIDLLLYGNEIVATESLIVPHPRMTFRRFVLEPASEIAGAMVHPLCGWTLSQMVRHLKQTRPVAALVASDSSQIEPLARALQEQLESQLSDEGATITNQKAHPEIRTTWQSDSRKHDSDVGLVIAWDCNSQEQLEDEQHLRNRISWRGPLAIVGGENQQAVFAEALAAIQAAWPKCVAAPPHSTDPE